MQIPQSQTLTTRCLSRIFDTTSATYKFFWFLSILQIHARTENLHINVWDIVIRMVANAWYPIHYFRLSFGKNDSLFDIVTELQKETQIPIDASCEEVIRQLQERLRDKQVKSRLGKLTTYVPYCFLYPWINATNNSREVMWRSQSFENGCLYSIYKEKTDFYIELNPVWDEYLHTHYKILMDFTYWNLMQFLQARNPNVPAISSKLIRPESRSSLANQHRYWNKVIQIGGPVRCIYTGHELHSSDYELDHFIPWSFVSHDLLWNLIPADGSINSSKSNYLPDLDIYLPKLAKLQHHSLKVSIQANYQPAILEDFLSLGYTPKEFVLMNEEEFLEVYRRTFGPMHQIALNMGFETWKY